MTNAPKKSTIVLTLVFLVFLIVIGFFFLNKYLYKVEEVYYSVLAKTGVDLYDPFHPLLQAIDEFNPFLKDISDGRLQTYKLSLSGNDLLHIERICREFVRIGERNESINPWRKARLEYNGSKYKVKFKIHGDGPKHWTHKFKSLQIKVDDGDYVNGMKRFSFMIFEHRKFLPIIMNYIAEQLNLTLPFYDIVVLETNDGKKSLYYMEEKLGKAFLEKNKMSNSIRLRNIDPSLYTASILYNNLSSDKIDSILHTFFQVINEYDDKSIIDFLDIDKVSSFEVWRIIKGDAHDVILHSFYGNLRLIYSTTTGKFYPIAITENLIQLQETNGSIEKFINLLCFLEEFRRPFFKPSGNYLFYSITRDDQIRRLRNQKLYSLVKELNLSVITTKIQEEYLPYLSYRKNHMNSWVIKMDYYQSIDVIKANLKIVKSMLERSNAEIIVDSEDNKVLLEIIPDSMPHVYLDQLIVNLNKTFVGNISISFFEGNQEIGKESFFVDEPALKIDLSENLNRIFMSKGLDKNLTPVTRKYLFLIDFEGMDEIVLNDVAVRLVNDATGNVIDNVSVSFSSLDINNFLENTTRIDYEPRIEISNLEFVQDFQNKTITVLPKEYEITDDIIMPNGYKLVIPKGTRLYLDEKVSILSYNGIDILGTKEEPVVISAMDKNRPFGSVGVIGNQETTSNINWLDLSYGNESWVNGLYFSGSLSIYHNNKVNIYDTNISNSFSDDGLIVKYSNVYLKNNRFFDNTADQVDLDYCTGKIEDSDFYSNKRGDYNGDGLDLSGATVLVKNNAFVNLLDKGVSIGEKSKVVLINNHFINNTFGIAVKDLSKAYIAKNIFENSNISIGVYQKKQIYGGAEAYVYNDNEFNSNSDDFYTDNCSVIYDLKRGLEI